MSNDYHMFEVERNWIKVNNLNGEGPPPQLRLVPLGPPVYGPAQHQDSFLVSVKLDQHRSTPTYEQHPTEYPLSTPPPTRYCP